ncbi:hypothetical protein BMT55_08625 [Listeria newyorkensis]|uniref:Uncharacterized protein n=1 Tax=Listeria newyorkensis TaxID=1497681 RepID=A0ABX4XMX8_9LIST|nr:hypothetical protein [Listeria newyorkensis]KGL44446.1 hypothetical protein EP58_04590 [Listeria newyorkensis]KMT62827.1 hypothetical protein X559_0823 [Listeria newyorkensis]PNP92302.1 hypothetical protein BMT55_08625 [Listeria newyorkensis]WAO20649.1 hypothetical protein OTR81_10110 [Listeria newyorkensis]SQC55000.1 Uncharacterised protein [Listeria newyorkensis]
MVIVEKAGHKEMVVTLLASLVAFLSLIFVRRAVFWFDSFEVAFSVALVLVLAYVGIAIISFLRSFKRRFQFFDRVIIYFSIPLSLCFVVFLFLLTSKWLS